MRRNWSVPRRVRTKTVSRCTIVVYRVQHTIQQQPSRAVSPLLPILLVRALVLLLGVWWNWKLTIYRRQSCSTVHLIAWCDVEIDTVMKAIITVAGILLPLLLSPWNWKYLMESETKRERDFGRMCLSWASRGNVCIASRPWARPLLWRNGAHTKPSDRHLIYYLYSDSKRLYVDKETVKGSTSPLFRFPDVITWASTSRYTSIFVDGFGSSTKTGSSCPSSVL